jgi:hypothetical protein
VLCRILTQDLSGKWGQPVIVGNRAGGPTIFRAAFVSDRALWSCINQDGNPHVDSIADVQDFSSGPNFRLVEKEVSREQFFDLTVSRDT